MRPVAVAVAATEDAEAVDQHEPAAVSRHQHRALARGGAHAHPLLERGVREEAISEESARAHVDARVRGHAGVAKRSHGKPTFLGESRSISARDVPFIPGGFFRPR